MVVVSIYMIGYGFIRVLGEHAYLNTDDQGKRTCKFGTLFDVRNWWEKFLAYLYLPCGFADILITGHRYWIEEDAYLYNSLDSHGVKAYLANKNKKNHHATYIITFDDGQKVAGDLGYLENESVDIWGQSDRLPPVCRGRSGFWRVEVNSIYEINGRIKNLYEIEFVLGKITCLKALLGNGFKMKIELRDGVRDGEFWLSSINAELMRGRFKNGIGDGEWKIGNYFLPQSRCIVNFKNGKLHGLAEVYYNGIKYASGVFMDDRPYMGTFVKPICDKKFDQIQSTPEFRKFIGDLLSYKDGKLVENKNDAQVAK